MNYRRAVIVGPAPCKKCGQFVVWTGRTWTDLEGNRHECRKAKAA